MKRIVYLLIFLLLSALAADWGAVARVPEPQAEQQANGEDGVECAPTKRDRDRNRVSVCKKVEYPLTRRALTRLRVSMRKKSAPVNFNPSHGYLLSLMAKMETATFGRRLSPFHPPVLYVFMSLRR